MLVKDVTDKFLEACQANGLAESTLKTYRLSLNTFLAHYRGPIECLDRAQVRQYVIRLRERQLAPKTVVGYVVNLKVFLNWAGAEGYIDRADDLPGAIKTPRLGKKRPRAIEQDTLDILMGAVHAPRDLALLCFLSQTGCRPCEVLRLCWQDLNLGGRTAHITGKGDKARVVFFAPECQEALRLWRRFHPGGDRVFCALETGRPLTYGGLRRVLLRLAKRAGLNGERCNPYSFRHFFAKKWLMGGGDSESLREMMGHEHIKTTLEAYVCFTRRELHEKYDMHAPRLDLGLGSNG